MTLAALVALATAPGRASAAKAVTALPDSAPHVSGPLTLPRALELTAKYPWSLRAADARVAGARARIHAADRWRNPVLSASEENFGGDLGDERREGTLEVAQTFELGGDRKARTATARAGSLLASAEAALLRREAMALTAERFITAWSLQVRLMRLREGERLTEQAVATANERYRAGAAPVLERSRAEAQALMQGVERQRVEAELRIARRDLASSWGAREATFDTLVAEPLADSLPRLDISSHPALERARSNESIARSRVREAQAAPISDVTLAGGLRRLEETRGTGFVASVGVPLPLWDRGQASVAAAREDYAAAQAESQAAARGLEVQLANAVDRARSAAAAYDLLRRRVRPARLELIEELLRAYRAGRLGYLDLIAEQRNLLETDLALVDAEADLRRARVELDVLVGTALRPGEDR